MIEEIMQNFLGSSQGQSALQALSARGYDNDTAQTILNHAVNGASEHLSAQTANAEKPEVGLFNIFGGHAGRDMFLGAVSGLLKGDGFGGAIKDGGAALLTGHIAEYLAARAGIDPTEAGEIAALLTPYIGQFVHEHLQNNFGSVLAGIL
jgi:hypothetical protein